MKLPIKPMLAHTFQEKKGLTPSIIQPKLDGMRCIAKLENGKCELWSRGGKRITSAPHVVNRIEKQFAKDHRLLILDGELYIHGIPFESVISQARKDVTIGDGSLEYWVYDCIYAIPKGKEELPLVEPEDSFLDRYYYLKSLESDDRFGDCLILLRGIKTSTVEHVKKKLADFIEEGFEGAIIRDIGGQYTFGRSHALLKYKIFDTSDYKIVGVLEGVGTMKGCAVFVCEVGKKEFRCKLVGEFFELRKFWKDPSLVVGKKLTVKHFGFTNGKMPRFPIGLIVRDYE